MQILYFIAQMYATTKNASIAYDELVHWVVDTIHKLTTSNPNSVIERNLRRLAQLDPEEVRPLVAKAFEDAGRSGVGDDELKPLVELLENLTRNVRVQTSAKSLGGNLLHPTRLANLVGRVDPEPVRHCGEPVTRGSAWILRRHLGSGGFGEVWLAENPEYPVPRAYKFFTESNAIGWFGREQGGLVAVLKRLGEHPHVVEFQDAQSVGCDHPFLAFEYLAGGSLADWFQASAARRPSLDPDAVVRGVVAGLAAAHQQGIGHNDIKPANLLLTAGAAPEVKIADFGLARVDRPQRDAMQARMSVTESSGTPLYLPPDAGLRGVARTRFQNDVFAVGVVWYQLLVGEVERPPYDFAARLRLRGVDLHTVGLVERCLAHPDRRFKHARELEEAFVDTIPPPYPPAPGVLDVQHLAREYLATMMG